MAVYEYHCRDCSATFTLSHSISEHDKKGRKRPACPECKGRNTRQVFAPFYAKTSSKA